MPFINKQDIPTTSGNERSRQRNCQSLIDQLIDENPTARRWAARDLAECPESAGALLTQLNVELDHSVREVIFSTLTKIKTPEAIAGLVDCLRSEDAAIRNSAITALAQCPDEVSDLMALLLKDPDPDIRIFAVNILESLCIPDVESMLISVIAHDPHVNVCATAVGLLAEIATSASRASLEAVSRRFENEPFLIFAVELALKRIGKEINE